MRRVLGCAALVMLVFSACNGDAEGAAPATTTTTSTTTTAPADPYAIPETIDIAYVQRVIDKLYEIEAEAAAEIVANKELVPSAAERLRGAFVAYQLNRELSKWNDAASKDFVGYRTPPGLIRVQVSDLVAAERTCIHARTTVDLSGRFEVERPPVVLYTVLVQAPTPANWAIKVQAAGGLAGEPLEYDPCVTEPSS